MRILPVLLTSEHPENLKISLKQMGYIPELTIFVDTWDESYKRWVVDTYSDYYNVVVSNSDLLGSPGRGKNLVLDYFLNSDYTHLVPVDGDDFLWTGAIEKLANIIEKYPADFFHYEYTDMFYSTKHLFPMLTSTKEWFKGNYQMFIEHDVVERIHGECRMLRYNYDVDRIAVETKKSAEYKYVEDVYNLEDAHRNIRLKHAALVGELKGYTINSRDLYAYVKPQRHCETKRRPRHFKPGRNPSTYNFNFDCGSDWHTNECIVRSKTLLKSIEDLEPHLSARLPSIKMKDTLSYQEKINFYNENYASLEGETIDYSYYVDPNIGNMFEHYSVESGEDIGKYIKEKV